ncbi:MAG TPA: hypothetical protein VF832_11665, partial [Longimicrobiales bacterium]
MSELVDGSPDPGAPTTMLNRGDAGLLSALDRLTATAASATPGGASIAAHADHLRYGIGLLNRWAAGEAAPWEGADWTISWKKQVVTEEEWRTLRQELRREASAWREALRTVRQANDVELGWVVGSVAHVAYHMGAIRQIDRAARGPTAEDERRAEAAL